MSLFAGTTVTASAAGHTTRTTPLDLTSMETTNMTATEGWSWDKESTTLTLSGCTIEVDGGGSNTNAITLPAKSKIQLADGTNNKVTLSNGGVGYAILASGLTIEGSGTLEVTSSFQGIVSQDADLVIKSPISVKTTDEYTPISAINVVLSSLDRNTGEIKIADTLEIKKPVGGKIHSSGRAIVDSNDNDAKEVVISAKGGSTETPTFNDGFGNANITSGSYTVDNEYAVGSGKYVFAGWYASADYSGGAVTEFTNGTTYYAKWTKNDKTVRTTALDLRDTDTNQSSSEEGWSWNAETKTLTLSGATIDIPESNTSAIIAVCLPDGATVKTDASTKNTICNSSEAVEGAIGLMGMGALTINGSGELSITGKVGGILSIGALTINAPLIATITGEEGMAVSADNTITLDSSVSIKTPTGGKVCAENRAFIGDSDGTPAKEVVIGSSSTSGGDTPGQITKRTIPLMLTANNPNVTDTNRNPITPTQEGSNTIYKCPEEGWSYNATTYTLTLSGANFDISNTSDPSAGYAIKTPDKVGKIILAPGTKNNVSIHSASKYPVMAIATTAISGDGDLTVSAVADNAKCSGIGYPVDGNIPVTLEGCSITVEKVESKKEKGDAYGINADYGSLTITANSEKDNIITIKSVKAGTKGYAVALSGMPIIAKGATINNAARPFISGKTSSVQFKDETQPVVLSFATNPGSENITITPSTGESLTVAPGGTLQFKANVNDVTWSVRDNKSNDTKIDANGLLTVGADETASSISVIATSKGDSTKSCTVSVKIPQAAPTYTVQFNTNGGSAVAPVTVSENSKLPAPTAPTKAGYTFLGWYKDAAFTNRWNFDADTVTGNTTLYAKWTAKTYGISGTVYAYDGATTASGVTVKLMKGDTQVASTTSATDGTGKYSFTGIAPGVYNIVAEKDNTTQTTLVIVTNHNETDKNVTLPQSKVNSKLTVNGADTPDVVAGGLDKEAAAVKAENSSATLVKVEMTVESKSSAAVDPTDKTNIGTVASGKTLEYLDIKVIKTVDGNEDAITKTENMMEIVIPYDMTGKSNITVYRNHSGSAAPFTQLNTLPGSGAADGTYYLDTVNHLIYVYTQKFSTYAIGYNTQSGGSGSGGSSSGGGSSSSSGGSSSGNSSTISTPSAKNDTVSVSPKSASKGTTVTVTVTPDKGYVLETLTVTDASGKKLDLKNLGSGKYSFTMPASKVEVKATFMEDNTMLNYFVDVPASAYYYDAVLWAAEQGITGGTDATHFSPDGVCTRAQAVTFLWRAAGSPAPSATAMPFTDVAADSYYYNAVLWAMENGITVGTSSTTFSPDLKCSRAHIMTFLWRSEKSPAAGSVNPFTDVSADAYYADAVLWAVKESVTNGTSSATFSPDADCTRAQIVTFIWRTLAR